MHVLLIHQGFTLPNEAGGTRHFELARRAVEQGHQFTVVASDIKYFTGQRSSRSPEIGSDDMVEGVRVLRSFTTATLHGNFAGQLFSFLSFAMTSILAALRVKKVDVVMGTTPPPFSKPFLPGWLPWRCIVRFFWKFEICGPILSSVWVNSGALF